MKKAFNIIQNLEILLAVVILLLLLIPNVFGYKNYVVETGSMEPNLPTYSIAYVKRENATNIKTNDIIAFHIDEKVVTHRVVNIDNNEDCFVTKGDANKSIDPIPVKYENCIGVIKFHIPYLGHLINFMQTPKGIIILGGVIVLNIILSVIANFKVTTNNKKLKRRKEND